MKQPIRPEDILPDDINSAELNGITVRKGTIAAFLANVEILEDPQADAKLKQAALVTLEELVHAVIAIGLHKHVVFKNPIIEEIIGNAVLYHHLQL